MLDTYEVTGRSLTGQELSFSTTAFDVNMADGSVVSMYAMEAETTGPVLPLTCGMTVNFMLKDGYTVPEKSDFAFAGLSNGTITYTDGTTAEFPGSGFTESNNGVLGSKIFEYTQAINASFGFNSVTLTQEGVKFTSDADED